MTTITKYAADLRRRQEVIMLERAAVDHAKVQLRLVGPESAALHLLVFAQTIEEIEQGYSGRNLRCPYCLHYKDTPNHEFGCVGRDLRGVGVALRGVSEGGQTWVSM